MGEEGIGIGRTAKIAALEAGGVPGGAIGFLGRSDAVCIEARRARRASAIDLSPLAFALIAAAVAYGAWKFVWPAAFAGHAWAFAALALAVVVSAYAALLAALCLADTSRALASEPRFRTEFEGEVHAVGTEGIVSLRSSDGSRNELLFRPGDRVATEGGNLVVRGDELRWIRSDFVSLGRDGRPDGREAGDVLAEALGAFASPPLQAA